MLMDGGFLSTMLPPTGPAVAQFPAKSQTECVPVGALAVSVPAGTAVLSAKPASEEFAKPEPESLPLHAIVTSVACQTPSAAPQLIEGGVLSSITITCLGVSALPALSVAKKVMVVVPSVEMTIEADAAFTVVPGSDCAPLAL